VGVDYLSSVIRLLPEDNFHLTFVGQASPALRPLQAMVRERPSITLLKAGTSQATIDEYEKYYAAHVVGAEITKPSEQAFKVLAPHDRVGGNILLFARPVDLQEYENLAYLTRYHLIPTPEQHQKLYQHAKSDSVPTKELQTTASGWRGLRLSEDPLVAAKFIIWCRKHLFAHMGSTQPKEAELQPDGAACFWQTVLQ
jgi:hypothetical protein